MLDRMDRRTFLARASAAAALLSGCGARPIRCDTPQAGPGQRLDPLEWRTVQAAQEVILPSKPGSPGAREVQATAYLDAALAFGAQPGECETVKRGAHRLDALAVERGAFDYAALDAADAGAVLRQMLKTYGNEWFVVVLGYTLEAFLGDPVHGGNPDGIGWKWVGHAPGWPRPPTKGS